MTDARPGSSNLSSLPFGVALLASLLVGAVYFIPQGFYFLERRNPAVLFEENFEESSFAVLVSRRAGEHTGQPDPYRLRATDRAVGSSFAVQSLPPAALAGMARLFGVRSNVIFWAGAFLFPALVAFLFASIAAMAGLRGPVWLLMLVTLSLLSLPPPYWLILGKQLTHVLAGQATDFAIALPYSRRFQPQFSGVVHYFAIAASVACLSAASARPAWLLAAVAGVFFGASFYCYFFSWTLLAGWFALGAIALLIWNRSKLKLCLLAMGTGLAISTGYWLEIARHFDAFRASAGAGSTHRLASDLAPDVAVFLGVAALLAALLRRETSRPLLLWTPLILNLAAALGVLQNVLTGIYIQPFHYAHYFGRPMASFGLVAAAAVFLQRHSVEHARPRLVQAAVCALTALIVTSAVLFQLRHYLAARTEARPGFEALPAMKFLAATAAPGAMVYCTEQQVREALPLETDAVPYFSTHMWGNETPETVEPLLQRIAAAYVLGNTGEAEFEKLVRQRPWEMFCNYLQRRLDARTEARMQWMEGVLLRDFRATLQASEASAFGDLSYALLPARRPPESTRLPLYFECRKRWSDGRYSVFELKRRGNGARVERAALDHE